jgi:hypothetical protein
MDIDREVAERAWQELRQLSVPLRVVNRDFARYEVMLRQARDTPQVRRCLVELGGMSEGMIPQMLRNLPVVVRHGVRRDDAEAALSALTAVGATGTAELVTLQRFSLTLDPIHDPTPLLPILRNLGEINDADALSILRNPSPFLPGPFTATHARWLAHELTRAGASVQLEPL